MRFLVSQSNSSKPRPLSAVEPLKSNYAKHHATVSCHDCNRNMVPRVVSYYGQPLKSICPFCGTTFMKFPSGFQRLLQCLHTGTLSFGVFKQLSSVALCFGLLWYISVWVDLPEKVNFIATIGTLVFAVIASTELIVQCVEQCAERLSHESNLYWGGIVLIAVALANYRHDLIDYIFIFFGVMLFRWVVFGFVRVLGANRQSNHQ